MSIISTAVRIIRERMLSALLVACVVLAMAPMQGAQAAYPERQITIIVCFPAGGGTDVAVRMISTELGEALGKPVIVENRSGAGGNIGIAAAAHAMPDGYTLLGCSSAFVVNPSLYAHVSYDPLKDFTPLMLIGSSPNVLVVPAASKFKTAADLIAAAKANPGKLNWTSPGLGTTPQLAGELFKLRTGINIVHIPYPGAGPAMTAVLGGQVDMYAANYGSVSPLIKSGKVRAIAVTAKQRWRDIPDVPTLEELGIRNAETDTFQALFAPAGTPQLIVAKLADTLKRILARPDVRAKYEKSGLPVVADGPQKFRAVVERQLPMYKDVIDKAGLQVK